jgi:hypothetical protein
MNTDNQGSVIPSKSLNATEIARAEIDGEIIKVNEQARLLKSRRNGLAPISRLPLEVLCQIFKASYSSAAPGDFTSGGIIPCLVLTQVCGHFRSAAIGCPSLWTDLIFSHPSWTEEMLLRSKAAPLVVKADVPPIGIYLIQRVTLALEQIARIRVLNIRGTRIALEKLFGHSRAPARLLQSLRLSNVPENAYDLIDSNDPFHLPGSIFDSTTSRIRHLELSNCVLAHDVPLFECLTYLEIHHTNISTPQILAVFNKMPSLEILILEDALSAVSEGVAIVGSAERAVHFSKLSRLDLYGPVHDCAFLLSHLTYQSVPTLKLTCRASGRDDFSSISPFISGFGADGRAIRSLAIEVYSASQIRVKGWIRSSTDPHYTPTGTPQIDLCLTWYHTFLEKTQEELLTAVCQALPLSELHTLCVGMDHLRIGKAGWRKLFSYMGKLREVNVWGQSAEGLILALQIEEEIKKGRKASLVLPRLRDVLFTEVNFGGDDVAFEMLQDCLISRCNYNIGVHELHLQDCRYITEDDVALLEEIVVTVCWDGIELCTETEEEVEDEDFYDEFNDEYDSEYSDDSNYGFMYSLFDYT